jgi:hypothetical protein
MEIIKAEQQTISLSKSFRLKVYRMPNGDLGIGTEDVRQVLGYKNIRLTRLPRSRKNTPNFLRRAGFTPKIQVVSVQSLGQTKKVRIISVEDFTRLVFFEASRGNEQAIKVQSLLAKSGLRAYTVNRLLTEESTERDSLEKRYDAAHQKVIESMEIDELGELETEEDILSVAVSLTR